MSTQNIKAQRHGVIIGALLVAGAYLAFVGWVGASDYDQAVADQAFYCQMVEEGAWPKDPARGCPATEPASEPLVVRNIASL